VGLAINILPRLASCFLHRADFFFQVDLTTSNTLAFARLILFDPRACNPSKVGSITFRKVATVYSESIQSVRSISLNGDTRDGKKIDGQQLPCN
jgi:hypothetical protein